ncbi:hypothetical protein ACFLVI_04485, partial [Chloroflexota bacterium]
MIKKRLKHADGQRGFAFPMVLIALAVGASLIIPSIDYVRTGIDSTEISEDTFLTQSAAEAAVEYSLWQLEYNVDGILDQLSVDDPSHNTSLPLNDVDVQITTQISQSPDSESNPFEPPILESGIHLAVACEMNSPVWIGKGQKCYSTHMLYIYNYGSSAVHLKSIFQELDVGLTYVQGSYQGPSADFSKNWVGDHWELYWDLDEPLPKLNPMDMIIVTFTTYTQQKTGDYIFSIDGWVEYSGFQEETVETYSGASGTASFSLYDISVEIGSYVVLLNVGVTD